MTCSDKGYQEDDDDEDPPPPSGYIHLLQFVDNHNFTRMQQKEFFFNECLVIYPCSATEGLPFLLFPTFSLSHIFCGGRVREKGGIASAEDDT